jgi:hypothetical protein
MQDTLSRSAEELGIPYDHLAKRIIMAIGLRRAAEFLAKQYSNDAKTALQVFGTTGILPYLGVDCYEISPDGSVIDPHVSRATLQEIIREVSKFHPWVEQGLSELEPKTNLTEEEKEVRRKEVQVIEAVIDAMGIVMGFGPAVRGGTSYKTDLKSDKRVEVYASIFERMSPQEREQELRELATGEVLVYSHKFT